MKKNMLLFILVLSCVQLRGLSTQEIQARIAGLSLPAKQAGLKILKNQDLRAQMFVSLAQPAEQQEEQGFWETLKNWLGF